MYSSVLYRAVQKLELEPLNNLKFILLDAKDIAEVFDKGEVDRIYLNFSDPWPKDRHAKRRLPSRQFLARFDQILKADGVIEFKTDNKDLFAFAEEEVEPAGWKILEITYDLHNDEKMVQGNIMTEYEEKFSSMGNPIYKYIIRRKFTKGYGYMRTSWIHISHSPFNLPRSLSFLCIIYLSFF